MPSGENEEEVQLIWVFTRYYSAEELRIFFHPMTDEQVPFRSLVLTHYRKAEFTDKLAELCGYGLHNFRKVFKREFGMSPYKWLMMKRAEHIRYKLSQTYIPFADIIDEFNFSSAAHFSNSASVSWAIRRAISEKHREKIKPRGSITICKYSANPPAFSVFLILLLYSSTKVIYLHRVI